MGQGQRYFSQQDFPDFMGYFLIYDYSFDGRRELAKAISHLRRMDKPHWVPAEKTPLILIDRKFKNFPDLESERSVEWTLDAFAAILNREWNADEDSRISRDRLFKLENPHVNARGIDLRLVEKIAGLDLLLNPKTGVAYNELDLRAIAKEMLDWQTGEYHLPSYVENGVNGN